MESEGAARRSALRNAREYGEPLLFFLLLLAVWEWAVWAFEIKRYLLPAPSAIGKAIHGSAAVLFEQSWVTLKEVLLGFAAAALGGVALAVGIFAVPVIKRTVYPLVVALQGIPKVALAPVIVVWLGYGIGSKVLMSFLFAVFPVVISTLGGLYSTPQNLEEHFRALKASRWATFWRLRAPSAAPNFVDGCKVAMPLAVIGAIVGEFVGSQSGLGHLIVFSTGAGRTDLTFAAIAFVTVLSLLLYGVIEGLGRLAWWRGK